MLCLGPGGGGVGWGGRGEMSCSMSEVLVIAQPMQSVLGRSLQTTLVLLLLLFLAGSLVATWMTASCAATTLARWGCASEP